MHFSECKTIEEFKSYFLNLRNKPLSKLTLYETVVAVIYDSCTLSTLLLFLAIYRYAGFINKEESDEIESKFEEYIRLKM